MPAALFPLCNIAIGTGVAVTLTNSKGEVRSGSEMIKLFGVEEVWNFQVEREGSKGPGDLWKVLGGDHEGDVRAAIDPDAAQQRQAERCRRLLFRLHVLAQGMQWTPPRSYCFTGGVMENTDLVPRLQGGALPDGAVVLAGPFNAGLVGAAIAAAATKS